MALLTELTGDQLTAIRSDNHYHTLQFVCLVPNTVVVQFNPSVAPTSLVYAQITVGAIASGSMSNIRQGQLVIFSSTADYQATENFRTRVRKVSGTSILYVGENSQSLTTSDYVTVINTYEVQERLRNSVTLIDWDIPFRKLVPIETALPSAVVLTNGATAYTPTAVPKAMDDSATSSFTHAWESSNGSDTLNSGGTTASPNWTLQAASFRWLRYTFIDSNGNSNYRVIPVWTVPKNYASVVALGFGDASGNLADINFDAELGWNATVPAWDGIDALLNRTFCVIASDEWYDDERQSIRTNINFVGYLQNEDSNTAGDEQSGSQSETRFNVEGFGHQLARQNISAITIFRTAGTPTTWDTVQNPTPGRMLTYRLTEYSTILNLCSLSIPADDEDFIGDDINLTSGKALDDIRTIAGVINAELQFDVDGHLDLCRDLNFGDDTARDAADVVATLSITDFLTFAYDYDYSKTTSQVTLTGGDYETSLDRYDLTEAVAPAVARLGEGDPQQISNQVLLTNSTQAEADVELAQRAANHFAANNPTYSARGTLKDEWHFVIPDVGSWFKFDIAGTDTARGKEFGVNDRWQLVQISVSTNNPVGRRQVNYTFRHETRSTGAMVRAHPIIHDTNADISYVPAVLAPFVGENLDYTDGNYYDSQDVAPPSDPNPVGVECELGGLRIKSGTSYVTSTPALNGERIATAVRGSGLLAGNQWCYEFSVANGNLSDWTAFNNSDGLGTRAVLNGDGWGRGANVNVKHIIQIYIAFAATAITSVDVYTDTDPTTFHQLHCPDVGAADFLEQIANGIVASYAVNTTTTGLWVSHDMTFGTTNNARINKIVVQGTGDNPFGDDNCGDGGTAYGDAFYYWIGEDGEAVPYGAGEGLLVEFGQPTSIPPYNPEHEYQVFEIVTSGPITYEFESPYALAEASNWSLQIITCFLGVP